MQTKVIMPQMGESIVEGTITKWLKRVGDRVQRDEPLFEISTDKVDSEIPAPATGILNEILVPEGQTVQVNAVLAVIEEAAPAGAEVPGAPEAPSPQPGQPAEARPVVSESIVSPQVTSARAASQLPPADAQPQAPVTPAAVPARDIRTSPLVRRIARENNLDLALVPGTGLDNRITKEDVLQYLTRTGQAVQLGGVAGAVLRSPVREPAAKPDTLQPSAGGAVQAPVPAEKAPIIAAPEVATRPEEEASKTVPMTQMRRMIAEHMVLSRRTSAHVNTVFEVDMTAIVKLREESKHEFEQREGIKLTFTPFFAKAVVETVREFPLFNSSVSGDSIIYKKPINLGIAVSLDKGLIVPVVKDAHLKSFTGLALAINDLAQRARTKRLKPDEAQDGTISITNPGIYGPLFATPIINQPQVAILGIGGIEKRPVVVADAIAIRSMVYLSLSFDHRVIDGAVADQFMARLKDHLQSWTQWRE